MSQIRRTYLYMPTLYGHTLLGHNSAIFGQMGWNFSWELRRLTSIDWPSDIYGIILILRLLFVVPVLEKKLGCHMSTKRSVASKPNKKLAHWVNLLGRLFALSDVLKFFRPETLISNEFIHLIVVLVSRRKSEIYRKNFFILEPAKFQDGCSTNCSLFLCVLF